MLTLITATVGQVLLQLVRAAIATRPLLVSTPATLPAIATQGPRPEFLVNTMRDSPLKTSLEQCLEKPAAFFVLHDFSIGHRGAPLMFPEHTRESYLAAVQMGSGIVECDIAVTQDSELVCRHSQCDLHTTTNILDTDLASKCTEPFAPATNVTSASAKCCTSDITLAEFKTLCGKMDASDSSATTVEG